MQPLIWLLLFGALFSNAPEGFVPGGSSYGQFLGAGVIVFTAFSGALNAGLPVMFDREFGFLNRLLVAPLRSRNSIVFASVIYIASLSILQSLVIMGTAAFLGYGFPNLSGLLLVLAVGQVVNQDWITSWSPRGVCSSDASVLLGWSQMSRGSELHCCDWSCIRV